MLTVGRLFAFLVYRKQPLQFAFFYDKIKKKRQEKGSFKGYGR
jgi:hypothetical protein